MKYGSSMDTEITPEIAQAEPLSEGTPGFSVHLDNFDGPFDLLLQLPMKSSPFSAPARSAEKAGA